MLVLAGCAPEATPLFREDFDRLHADVLRVEQSFQKGQRELKVDLQQADRRATLGLSDIQKSVARLSSRLDDLGRETGQIQGRLDELRRRVDALTLEMEVAGAPPGGAGSPARPGGRGGSGGTAAGPGAAGPPPSPTSQATELYQTAYIDYTRGNFNLAIAAFKEFVRLYPRTDLAEKAQYWIGESHFSLARSFQAKGERDHAVQELERAVQEFRKVLVNHPRGDRVPTALYKEALALAELGQAALAEARLQFLIDQYPSTEEAAKAREDLVRLRKR